MKKGFTLVEVILSISLIFIIGACVTFGFVSNNKEEKKLADINKKILEAANLYASVEKDENGNSFFEEIYKGAKGIQVPVTNLVNKGYIDSSLADDLYKLKGVTKKDGESYYVLFVSGGIDYCNKDQITSLTSWMNEGKNVYLCNDYKISDEKYDDIISEHEYYKFASVSLFAVSKEFYDKSSDAAKKYLTYKENGIFHYMSDSDGTIYSYYRGAVNNNYLKLGTYTDASGNKKDLIWRILWYNDTNKMKLVLDENIPLSIVGENGNPILLTPKAEIFNIISGSTNYFFINPDYEYQTEFFNGYRWKNYIYTINSEKVLSSFIDLRDDIYSPSNFYLKELKTWYGKTNLKDFSYITKTNNFCSNHCCTKNESNLYEDYQLFKISTSFECFGNKGSGDCTKQNGLIKSSEVGFLTSGDLIRAGVVEPQNPVVNLLNSGNFLISSNDNIILSDKYEIGYYSDRNSGEINDGYQQYFFSIKGIKKDYIYNMFRHSYDDNWQDSIILQDTSGEIFDGAFEGRGAIVQVSTFLGNALKPVIVLDLTDYELSKTTGTVGNEYTIVAKTST